MSVDAGAGGADWRAREAGAERSRLARPRLPNASRPWRYLLVVVLGIAIAVLPGSDAGASPRAVGYWLVASDGGVFSFGDVGYYGSATNIRLDALIVGIAATPDGRGYWLVASDGGVFSFGDATFEGSMGGGTLSAPIVGIAAEPNGRGYWLVDSDGEVLRFRTAGKHPSARRPPLPPDEPVAGMAATPSGPGYWIVASNGDVSGHGTARNHGTASDLRLNGRAVGMAATPAGTGYWIAASDGGVFAYGSAVYYGSTGDLPLRRPIVAFAPGVGTRAPAPKSDVSFYLTAVALIPTLLGLGALEARFLGSIKGRDSDKPKRDDKGKKRRSDERQKRSKSDGSGKGGSGRRSSGCRIFLWAITGSVVMSIGIGSISFALWLLLLTGPDSNAALAVLVAAYLLLFITLGWFAMRVLPAGFRAFTRKQNIPPTSRGDMFRYLVMDKGTKEIESALSLPPDKSNKRNDCGREEGRGMRNFTVTVQHVVRGVRVSEEIQVKAVTVTTDAEWVLFHKESRASPASVAAAFPRERVVSVVAEDSRVNPAAANAGG